MVEQISNLKFQISNPERTHGIGPVQPSASRSGTVGIGPVQPSASRSGTVGIGPPQASSPRPATMGISPSRSATVGIGPLQPSRSANGGFTLLELMVVITILLILATMSMPIFQLAIVHAREAVLKDDLFTLRKLIDEYTLDKQHPPATLDDLVEAGYLRSGIPVDPFTGSNQTWQTDVEEVPTSPSQTSSGIVDLHSGSDGTALDGTAYSSW